MTGDTFKTLILTFKTILKQTSLLFTILSLPLTRQFASSWTAWEEIDTEVIILNRQLCLFFTWLRRYWVESIALLLAWFCWRKCFSFLPFFLPHFFSLSLSSSYFLCFLPYFQLSGLEKTRLFSFPVSCWMWQKNMKSACAFLFAASLS